MNNITTREAIPVRSYPQAKRADAGINGTHAFWRFPSSLFNWRRAHSMSWYGSRDGAVEMPNSYAKQPSRIEKATIAYYSHEVSIARSKAMQELKLLENRFSSISAIPSAADVNYILNDIDMQLALSWSKIKEKLDNCWRRERDAFRQWRFFRTCHSRVLDANYPESRIHHFSLVFIIIFLECLLSMHFLSEGDPLGYLGALVRSLLISISNVGAIVILGYFGVRNINHCSIVRKLLGFASLLLAVGFVLSFNLLVVHFRDAYTSNAESALDQSIMQLFNNPGDISLHGLMMYVMALTASALALYKGYTADDPYPGHGEVDRHYQLQKNRFEQQCEIARDAQHNNITEGETKFAELVNSAKDSVSKGEQVLQEIGLTLQEYDVHQQTLEDECKDGLQQYRDSNKNVRTTPKPEYFNHFPSITVAIVWNHLEELEKELEGIRSLLDQLHTEVIKGKEELIKRLDRQSGLLEQKCKHIDTLRSDEDKADESLQTKED